VAFDPYAPYGTLAESAVRVVTWNVWGRYGPAWKTRQLFAVMLSSPGYTWSNRNPLAAVGLYPDRRFDYIFSAWPRRHGVGHPVHCALLGVRAPGQDQISDHYGLVADLRH
jgi:hypothetical protein